jgi:hypothetical protein
MFSHFLRVYPPLPLPRCYEIRYQVSFLLIHEYSLTVHTVEVEPSSELPHAMDDAYEGINWDSFNDMTLSDSDSGNESAFEAAAEECLRGVPVLGPPETNLNGDGSGYRQKRKTAYVVFNGREMGVFQTW